MHQEIERRFIPKDPNWRPTGAFTHITQGYFELGKTAFWKIDWLKIPPVFMLNGEPCARVPLLKAFALSRAIKGEGWKARIRCYDDDRYVLDIKGPRTNATRFEVDELPLIDQSRGPELLEQAGHILKKKRYYMPHKGHVWHVDVFEGDCKEPVTCEVELKNTKAKVELPPWVGEEITHRKLFSLRPEEAAPNRDLPQPQLQPLPHRPHSEYKR